MKKLAIAILLLWDLASALRVLELDKPPMDDIDMVVDVLDMMAKADKAPFFGKPSLLKGTQCMADVEQLIPGIRDKEYWATYRK